LALIYTTYERIRSRFLLYFWTNAEGKAKVRYTKVYPLRKPISNGFLRICRHW